MIVKSPGAFLGWREGRTVTGLDIAQVQFRVVVVGRVNGRGKVERVF